MSKKVVINKCYGGYSLSKKAYEYLGLEWDGYGYLDMKRDDPKLVACVETLGNKANGTHAELAAVEIPDDVDYIIEEYDGFEHIAEKHRTWD